MAMRRRSRIGRPFWMGPGLLLALLHRLLLLLFFLLEVEPSGAATAEGFCVDETLGNGRWCSAEPLFSKLFKPMGVELPGKKTIHLVKPHQGAQILPIPAVGGSSILLAFGEAWLNKRERKIDRLPVCVSGSIYRSILQDALFKADAHIDSTCSTNPKKSGCGASSTAVVLLKVDGHQLLSNSEASKASSCIMHQGMSLEGNKLAYFKERCVCRFQSNLEGTEIYKDSGWRNLLCLQELASDYQLDRHQEKAQIETADDWTSKFHDTTLNHYLAIKQAIDAVSFKYILTRNVGRGGFGDIWLGSFRNFSLEAINFLEIEEHFAMARGSFGLHSSKHGASQPRESATGPGDPLDLEKYREVFVLKRILVEKGTAFYLSGMREKYFGKLFLNAIVSSQERLAGIQFQEENMGKHGFWGGDPLDHIVRFIECIETHSQEDFWLVFRNEGQSLSTLLYTTQGASTPNEDSKVGQIHALQPSLWWKWLKTTEAGQAEMRSLLYQLLLALKACHDRNITHRDIKPENMVVRAKSRCKYTRDDGHMQTDLPCNLTMRIIDFGSAIDPYTLQHLYGRSGPSRAEQTAEYTPPEAFLQGHWLKNHGSYGTMYDMWSIGVVMLELILGTPHVFQISERTRALLDQFLAGWDKTPLNTAYILRALWEMCILHPGHTAHQFYSRASKRMGNIEIVSWICTEESLMQQIKHHDPLGLGITNILALRLIRRLLQWYPEDRMSAAEALEHPYFYQV